MEEMIKVHLCAGKRDFGPEWISIDGAHYPHIKYHDITKLPFLNNVVDLIYCSHGIAYFDREEIVPILNEWKRVLKPDGILRIATPDFNRMMQLYKEERFLLSSFLGPLYGKMILNNKSIHHRTTYDFDSLAYLLNEVGFCDVYRYNWRQVEHADFDDHSQSYLPKMAKETGTLISLNVEATKVSKGRIMHGMAGSKTYRCWAAMLQRCNNPKSPKYEYWGGRGILIEDNRWLQFINFFNDMGECPQWGSIDRIDNNRGYFKSNCKWSDDKQQALNRRTNRLLEYKGQTFPLKKWTILLGLKYITINQRIQAGWSVQEAFETPTKDNRFIEFNNEIRTLSEWARLLGIRFDTLLSRLNKGWSVERTFTTPVKPVK